MFIITKTGLSNASTTFIPKQIILLPLVGKVRNYHFGKKLKTGLKTFLDGVELGIQFDLVI